MQIRSVNANKERQCRSLFIARCKAPGQMIRLAEAVTASTSAVVATAAEEKKNNPQTAIIATAVVSHKTTSTIATAAA